jgi:transposase
VGKIKFVADICLMNSEQIFQLALGLSEPWYVSKVEFLDGELQKELHLTIDYKAGFFIDKSGKSIVHDRVERKWRHQNFFEHKCYLHSKIPRVKTVENKVDQVSVPWAREGSGFTLLFEAFSMLLIEQEMPVNKVGKVIGEYPNRIWNIFNYWLKIAYSDADHSNISTLGIDETSSKKGHDYITVAVDMKTSRVVHATEGKGADTITKIADYLETKGTKREAIKQVCIDLSPSFISGVESEFSNAQIVFDRYHVKALLNKSMDDLRKQELKTHLILKGQKYLFLKNDKNMTPSQKTQRDMSLEALPRLGAAYRLKILFDDFWSIKSPQDAQGFLAYWCDMAREAMIPQFEKFADTVIKHWKGITNYSKYHISNGILEGTNSKIQLAKARGYRNKDNFINMIYFIAGKLKFNYPLYST